MKKSVIIVGGGSGIRMGGDLPKQFQLLKGKELLWHCVNAFASTYDDIEIVLVLPEKYLDKAAAITKDFPKHKFKLTAGGETRFQSVKNGLKMIDANSLVFIHDAVRCLVSADLIRRCEVAAMEKGNAIPATGATDTVRVLTSGGNEQLDRNKIKIIQTPQVFMSDEIKKAFETDYSLSFTDEASVAEFAGVKINLIEGEETYIKITRPIDMLIAAEILNH